MAEPTCIITGQVVGHPDTCGDCDPCIFGKASPPVKRLIDEINEWRDRYSAAMARCDKQADMIRTIDPLYR